MSIYRFARFFGLTHKLQRRPRQRARVRLELEALEGRIAPSATQTWISGVGDDQKSGSRTAPDKTISGGALANTSAGGTITALDSGGFGAATITKSITIDGSAAHASVLVSGTNGIVIAAGATDVVVLRNLWFQGLGSGLAGIKIVSAGQVYIENCDIQNLTGAGIDFEPTNAGAQLFVSNTDLIDNAGGGVLLKPSGVAATASIDNTRAFADKFGFQAQDNAQVAITNSIASGNSQNGFEAVSNTSAVHVNLVNDIASNNGQNGVAAQGGNAQVTYSGLTATGNSGQGATSVSSGVLTDQSGDTLADNGLGFTPISLALGAGSGTTRTWVSGIGLDANPGSRIAPDKTLSGAISKTSNAGEIDALDPGDFGSVTITKSIMIDGSAALAGISANASNGITIDAGASQVVILRGLTLDGDGQSGLAGISVVQAGAVIVEDCVIKNFSGAAIDFEPTNAGAELFVENTSLIDNAGGGILVKPNNVTARATIDNVQSMANEFGVSVQSGADVTVSNTVASGSTQAGFLAVAGASAAHVNLQSDVASNNGTNGVLAQGASAAVNDANLTAAGNSGQGALSLSNGVLTDLGGNSITDNGKGFTPITLTSGTSSASRIWISGVGNNAHAGSRTEPVQSFAVAIGDTASGGEIDALDPGAFGPVTINKSVTIDGGHSLAGISAESGAGITINAGAGDVVILRNLVLNGLGLGGDGIQILQAGAVIIENCLIEDFTGAGINFSPSNAGAQLYVSNTQVINNVGGGVLLKPNTGLASLDHVDADANLFGFQADDHADVTISNSTASASTQNGFQALSASLAAQMNLVNDVASNNGQNGILAQGAKATVAFSGTTLTGNAGQGTSSSGGGTLSPLANDSSAGNSLGFTPITLAVGTTTGPTRTWVSGFGTDSPTPASRVEPGLTFAYAYSLTSTGGQVDALDPGDFGTVTIGHSIMIDGTGQFAGIQAASGNGITVSAGPTDVVILRGLTLNGLGQTGLSGIKVTGAGAVVVEDCLIENFKGPAIDFEPTSAGAMLFVSNSLLLGNGGGILIKPNGASASALASIDHVEAQGNSFGIQTDDNTQTMVSVSAISGGSSDGLQALASAASSVLTLATVLSANNTGNGVFAQGPVAGSNTVSATVYLAAVASDGNGGSAFLAASSTPTDSFIVNERGAPAIPSLLGPANPVTTPLPTFSWTNTDADHYDLWVNDDTAGTKQLIRQQTLSGTSYVATSPLAGSHHYTAWVQAFSSGDQTSGWSQALTFTVQLPPPPGPPTLTGPAGNITTTTPRLTWIVGNGTPAGYDLWVSDNTAGVSQFIRQMTLPVAPTSYTTAALTLGHTYQFWVRAFDNLGQFSSWSASDTFTVLAPTPAVPTMLGPPNPTTTTALPTFSWSNFGADHYDLWVNDNTAGITQLIRQQTLATTSYVSTVALVSGHQYTAWVQAFNVTGQTSGWSQAYHFGVQLPSPPGAPTLTGPTGNINTLSATITWNAGSGTPAGYDLWVNDNTTGTNQLIRQTNLPASPTSFTTGNLTVGHQYEVWVRAFDSASQFSGWSSSETFTVGTVPGTPSLNPPSGVVISSSPIISWTAASNAATYELWVNDNTTGTVKFRDQTGITGTSATPVLTEGDNYTVWVRAINNLGEDGSWSAPLTFSILLQVPVITGPTPTPTSTTPTITWTESTSGAVRYDLWVDDATTGTPQVIRQTNLTTTSYPVVTALTHGHTYHVWVQAYDALGQGSGWQSSPFVFSVS